MSRTELQHLFNQAHEEVIATKSIVDLAATKDFDENGLYFCNPNLMKSLYASYFSDLYPALDEEYGSKLIGDALARNSLRSFLTNLIPHGNLRHSTGHWYINPDRTSSGLILICNVSRRENVWNLALAHPPGSIASYPFLF
jgi:hypothetical protein